MTNYSRLIPFIFLFCVIIEVQSMENVVVASTDQRYQLEELMKLQELDREDASAKQAKHPEDYAKAVEEIFSKLDNLDSELLSIRMSSAAHNGIHKRIGKMRIIVREVLDLGVYKTENPAYNQSLDSARRELIQLFARKEPRFVERVRLANALATMKKISWDEEYQKRKRSHSENSFSREIYIPSGDRLDIISLGDY